MKKILLITLEYPPQKGGVASYYAGFIGELTRQGHEVMVISQGLLSKWIWPKWLRAYGAMRRAIKHYKPDFLFVGHILPLGTVAYLLRRRVPYAVFTHGMDVLMAQKSWRKRMMAKKISEYAKLVVANSEFTKNIIESMWLQKFTIVSNRNRVVVVYPCLNQSIAAEVNHEGVEALRHRLGLNGKKVLLTLGRVVERKGHDIVIRALPEILQRIPSAVYVVAGTGPYLETLGRLAEELKLKNVVRFVGEVTDAEQPAYYAMCDLFVMPSRQIGHDVEGFGLSYLEAALFGKTAVGGASGGVPEAILDGKTGVLVNPNDPGAIARAVVQLLSDDALRARLGEAAKARVLQEFTWEKQLEKLMPLL